MLSGYGVVLSGCYWRHQGLPGAHASGVEKDKRFRGTGETVQRVYSKGGRGFTFDLKKGESGPWRAADGGRNTELWGE